MSKSPKLEHCPWGRGPCGYADGGDCAAPDEYLKECWV